MLGSKTDSFVFPVVSKYRFAIIVSLQEFGCQIVVLVELESSCYEMGPSFDYLADGAAVDYARGCVNVGRCLRLVHLASVSKCLPLSAYLSAISLKNSSLCDLILTKRVKRSESILALSSSRISRRMSPSGDFDGRIDSFSNPFLDCHQKTFGVREQVSGLLLPAYVIASLSAMHAAACSALLEDEPSSSLPTLQKLPVSPSCL